MYLANYLDIPQTSRTQVRGNCEARQMSEITTYFWIVQIYFLFACKLLHPLHLLHTIVHHYSLFPFSAIYPPPLTKKKEQPLAIAPYCDSYVTAIFTAVLGSTFRHQRSDFTSGGDGILCF